MKYIVIYKDGNYRAIVGFTNSLEDFLANNAKRSHSYTYNKDNIKLVNLTEDVFAPAIVEGMSNFVDYLR